MSSIPRLNYFVEKETAESATKNFAIILQKAFEQYQNLWDKYLDLVKVYEVDSPAHEEIQKSWKKESILKSRQVLPEGIDFLNNYVNEMKPWEKEGETHNEKENKYMIEDIFEACKLDFDSDIDDTICQTPEKETKNIILPESPIFLRKDEKIVSVISKKKLSTNNDDKTNPDALQTDDTLYFNKQHDNASSVIPEKNINDTSFNITSPVIICNSPMTSNNEYYKKNRKRLFKKACEYKQRLEDNPASFKRGERTEMEKKKIPLQALENIISPSKANLNYNETKTNYKYLSAKSKDFVQHKHDTISPDDKKLKQTTLPCYGIRNKVDKNVLKSTDKNVPIIKPKKFVFNSYTDNTLSQNEDLRNTKIDTMYTGNVNKQNKTIYDDVVENNPGFVYVQSQNKNPLPLKRKLSDSDKVESTELSENIDKFDAAFISPYNSPMKRQSQTFSTKKQNITFDDTTIFLTSGIVIDDVKEKCLEISEDMQLEQESVKKNNLEKIAAVELQESNLLDVSQYENEDETYFEEQIEKDNNFNVNKDSSICNIIYSSPTQETLTNTHKLGNPERNTAKKASITKSDTIKTKEGWSCWECAEYYNNKPGLSEECVQKWKNKCSRHRNVYYARQRTPPGFWDPVFPSSASDSL